jgi:hypothetical protein
VLITSGSASCPTVASCTASSIRAMARATLAASLAAAVKQGRAQLQFQPPDLVAHRAVGDVQLLGGAAVAAVAHRGLQCAQGHERRQAGHGGC